MEKYSTVSLNNHDYEFEMKMALDPYTCDGCKEVGFGPRYRCEKLNINLHKDCKSAMSADSISPAPDRLLNSLTLEFHEKPPPTKKCRYNRCRNPCQRYCDACGKPVKGFVFHNEGEDLDLHPCCRNLPRRLVLDLNDDDVKFKLRHKVSSNCIYCDRKKVRGSVSGIRGWSYVSECGEFHFHVYCATEMMIEGWKNGAHVNIEDDIGDANNNNTLMVLGKMSLPIQAQLQRYRRRRKYIKMLNLIFKVIRSILFGELLSGSLGDYAVQIFMD